MESVCLHIIMHPTRNTVFVVVSVVVVADVVPLPMTTRGLFAFLRTFTALSTE